MQSIPRTTITRKIEFDAGHRIPNHQGHCKNVHGHRYVLELSVSGPILNNPQSHEDGMLIDFGILKTILIREVTDRYDHAFIVSKHDEKMMALFAEWPEHKTVVLDVAPTVENIANTIFSHLRLVIQRDSNHQLQLEKIRLFETPNCWAEVMA